MDTPSAKSEQTQLTQAVQEQRDRGAKHTGTVHSAWEALWGEMWSAEACKAVVQDGRHGLLL